MTLMFLAQRFMFPPRADAGSAAALARPAVLAVAAGFTSFVAHAGSPPINAYVLPLRLQPTVYAGTMAVFFAALNLSKWIPYAWFGLIDLRNMSTGLLLMPLAPLGVWLGVWLARRIAGELVLPDRVRRHVLHRRQIAVGRFEVGTATSVCPRRARRSPASRR